MAKTNHALITGLFLFSLVTLTIIIIIWIGRFQKERNHYFVATRASVSGLNPESTVFFRGIAVGKVLGIQFDPNDSNTILIPIEVDKDIELTDDVYAVLQLKGVTGLTQLELQDTGSSVAHPLPPGNTNPKNRIPIRPSKTDQLLNAGEEILRKSDHLMVRLNAILSDENEKNINSILTNLKSLTSKLNVLEKSVDNALMEVPGLSKDAHKTLANIDVLAEDLRNLTEQVKKLGLKTTDLVDSGVATGNMLATTTLPKFNQLLTDLQATSGQVKRVARLLERDPQALLLGPGLPQPPAPGEPGYQEQP